MVVWAEGEIIDTVLQQDLHFFIFFFVVSSEHFQVLRKLSYSNPEFVVFRNDNGVFLQRCFKLSFQMLHFD